MNKPKTPPPSVVRCAIYTRKSTEDGLQQAFNTLDAQREACENYIRSQAGEGWTCLPDQYDDGGFTGANTNRPALTRLLSDIEAGRIDAVVTYKLDRLSRSLLDFTRLMEVFEKRNVALVSVTQAFSTATSYGRLTLNMLMSFAEFERQIISERTRDKIAATRRKGRWTGGHPILGYNVERERSGCRLEVDHEEALQVRQIFELYAKLAALMPVVRELASRGWATKRWTTKEGKQRGGRPFNKGSLFQMLTNVLYAGKVAYRDEVHPGEHEAIIDAVLFTRVQQTLQRNGRSGGSEVRNRYGALLRGVLRCKHCAGAMTHCYCTKKGGKVRYRYYVCAAATKHGWQACPYPSLPAVRIEQLVVQQIKAIAQDPSLIQPTLQEARAEAAMSSRDLTSEKAALERALKRHHKEFLQLGLDCTDGGLARLADLQEQVRVGERRMTVITDELAAVQRGMVTHEEVKAALQSFEPMWNVLSPREQAKVISLLVEQVEFDGENQSLSITFRPTGFRDVHDLASHVATHEEAA